MKTLKKLGVCPTPWEFETASVEHGGPAEVWGDNGNKVVAILVSRRSSTRSDASLIAAAPELYDCLYEALVEKCRGCDKALYKGGACWASDKTYCPIKRWRKALEKAGGAE